MGRWREAATDALATFALSRVIVLAVLLVPPTRVHSYLTTWDAGFYLSIARCGYDPACGAPVSAELPAFFPLQPLAARAAGTVGISAGLGRRGAGRARERRGADAAAPALQRAARAPHGAAGLRRALVLPVLVRAQHELLGRAVPAGLAGGLRRRALAPERPGLHWPAWRPASTRPAAIPLAIGLAADAALTPERRRAALAGAVGAVAGVAHRVRRSPPPPRRLARQPARAAARLAALDQHRRRARGARALHPRRDHARTRPEPAVPDGRAARRDRAGRALAPRHPRRDARLRGGRRGGAARDRQRDVAAALPDGHVPVRRGGRNPARPRRSPPACRPAGR